MTWNQFIAHKLSNDFDEADDAEEDFNEDDDDE